MNRYQRIATLVLADKADFLKAQGHDPKDVDWAMSVSPKQAQWLLKLHKGGSVVQGEDDQKLRELLADHEKAKVQKRLPPNLADINKFNSFGEAAKALEPYRTQEGKREEKRNLAQKGKEVLEATPDRRITKITTPEAAAELCRGTEWCVKDPKYSKDYLKQGPLYMMERADLVGYVKDSLHHYKLGQHKDVYDEDLEPHQIVEKLDRLTPYSGVDPLSLIEYAEAKRNLGTLKKTDLDKISMNYPAVAVDYAVNVLGRRWPEAEPVIARSPSDAVTYAAEVLKHRWPEAEPAIAQNALAATRYAGSVIQHRWPEAEPTIAKSAPNAYYYAKHVVKGRWPEAEPAILRDPREAENYASEVLKHRWPEAESTIAKDPMSAMRYAIIVLQSRWPEAESVISKDANAARLYAENVLEHRWPEAEPAILKDEAAAAYYAIYVLKHRWPEAERVIEKDKHWWEEYKKRLGLGEHP